MNLYAKLMGRAVARRPIKVGLIKGDPNRTQFAYTSSGGVGLDGPHGLPLFKPPYGRITAMDLNKGETLWWVPNANGIRDHPLLENLNLGPLGTVGRAGPVLTKTLLFVGEGPPGLDVTRGEPMFRAFDKGTGEILWEKRLRTHPIGTPMTYMAEGKQYVVVALGGRGEPAGLIAFSLP